MMTGQMKRWKDPAIETARYERLIAWCLARRLAQYGAPAVPRKEVAQ